MQIERGALELADEVLERARARRALALERRDGVGADGRRPRSRGRRASGAGPCWRPCGPVRSCPPAWRPPGRVRRDANTGTQAEGSSWRQLGYRRGRGWPYGPAPLNRPLEALRCVHVIWSRWSSSCWRPLLRRRLGAGRLALGRRDLQAAHAHRGVAVRRVRRRSPTPSTPPPTSPAGSCTTASRRAGRPGVGTDGDQLPAGTTLPAGQTFVFGKNAGDYTGTADALYGFQVTETGGFQIRDGAGAIQDGVGAPGTACAEGTRLTFPTTGARLHLHAHRQPTPTTTPPTSARRRARPTAPRAARRAPRRRPSPRSTRSRAPG